MKSAGSYGLPGFILRQYEDTNVACLYCDIDTLSMGKRGLEVVIEKDKQGDNVGGVHG